ncbi:hypothetical protein SISSUDRAFT_986740, partial [Sistotremastrum suecicum HHB10207 ss-3]
MDGITEQFSLLSHLQPALHKNFPTSLTLAEQFATIFSNAGIFSNAIDLRVKITEKYKQILGEDHPSTLTSMVNIAASYSALGKYADAEQLERIVLEKRRVLL